MGFLLFIISIIFSTIFYLFYDLSNSGTFIKDDRFLSQYFSSISWNLIIETLIFTVLWCVFLFLFSNFFQLTVEKRDYSTLKNFFKNNFKTLLYYIWFVLFYSSLYIILRDFSFDFSYIILTVNIIILLIYFSIKNLFIISDLLKVNTIIFSTIYIFLYINLFLWNLYNFIFIDYINSLLIFSSFFITLYREKVINKKSSDSWFLIHFFLYLFAFITFYFSKFFWSLSLLFTIFSFLINFYIFHFLKKIDFFKNNNLTLKVIWVVFSYMWIISWIYYLQLIWLNYIVVFIIIYLAVFNFKIHKLYENYTSFFLSSLWIIYILFYLYINLIYLNNFDNFYFLIFWITLSFFIIISTYIYQFEWIYDYYFTHIIALLVNFWTTIYFFYVNSFDLLSLWIILLFDSILIFLSYFKLKQIES